MAKKNDAPFSLRLTQEERDKLKTLAHGMPQGEYIRQQVFGAQVKPRRHKRRVKINDYEPLAQILGKLGQQRLANNLNQLAKAANNGVLTLDKNNIALLNEACADMRQIRELLFKALDMKG